MSRTHRRISALLVAGLALAAVSAAPPAVALGTAVSGTFLCQQSVTTGSSGAVSVGLPQTLQSTITAPATSDLAAPASAVVVVSAVGAGTLPVSPPVGLTGAHLTQVDVRLDVFVTAGNSPTPIVGAPATAAVGVLSVTQAPATIAAGTPWDMDDATPAADFLAVTAQLPPGAEGDRQWLRLKAVNYSWVASGGVAGTTSCRLIGPIPSSGGTSTVTEPVYGFVSPLSGQYPESATDFTPSTPGTFADFGDRVTVIDSGATPGPPSSVCTVTNPSGCTTGQVITGTVVAGTLTQQADAHPTNPGSTTVTMRSKVVGSPFTGASSVTTAATSQVMEGALNPVTVTDVRGGTAGWSLTATLSGPFVELGGGSMPAGAASLAVAACAPVAGSATRVAGTGGNLGAAVTLCGVDPGIDDSDGDSGAGQYTVSGALELTVPAYQKAGAYTSTLVVTLT